MKFVGADLHKESITFCVVTSDSGKCSVLRRERVLCKDVAKIVRLLQSLGEFQLVVEATIGYDWLAALAEKYAQRVVIAHAGKLRIIAESTCKTDKIDGADPGGVPGQGHDSRGLACDAAGPLAPRAGATPAEDSPVASRRSRTRCEPCSPATTPTGRTCSPSSAGTQR